MSDNGTIFEAGALVEALDVCRTCVRMEREDFSRGLVHGAQAMRQSHVDSVTANGRWFIRRPGALWARPLPALVLSVHRRSRDPLELDRHERKVLAVSLKRCMGPGAG